MSRVPPLSPKAMAAHGWTRVDGGKGKLSARWSGPEGWRLEHCGHPTALWPWALYNPKGQMVLTGAKDVGKIEYGTAWPTLREAVEWVATQLGDGHRRDHARAEGRSELPMRQPGPGRPPRDNTPRARAAYQAWAADQPRPCAWDDLSAWEQDVWREVARAAIRGSYETTRGTQHPAPPADDVG